MVDCIKDKFRNAHDIYMESKRQEEASFQPNITEDELKAASGSRVFLGTTVDVGGVKAVYGHTGRGYDHQPKVQVGDTTAVIDAATFEVGLKKGSPELEAIQSRQREIAAANQPKAAPATPTCSP